LVPPVVLILYVNPLAPASHRAMRVMDGVRARFPGVECEVVNVVVEFERAERDRVIFAPTLVKAAPEPRAWFVGDLADGGVVEGLLKECGMEERA
jgi:hypothetical protein